MSLSDLFPNVEAEIIQADISLASRGIIQGEKVKVLQKSPLLVQVGGSRWAISPEIAKEIKVKVEN